MKPKFLHDFKNDISRISEPKRFTFPFYYTPHELSQIAMKEVQTYLQNQNDFQHDFGLNGSHSGIGKMFGVLVVKNQAEKLGYLAAFSGKLANSNNHKYFVPPVFDLLKKDSFFLKREREINDINDKISIIETHPKFIELKELLNTTKRTYEKELSKLKGINRKKKQIRKEKRHNSLTLEELENLADESRNDKIGLKKLKENFNHKIENITNEVNKYFKELELLAHSRKYKSNLLQKEIFKNYKFLNAKGDKKELLTIFNEFKDELPPAGAGECAAPKLLNYAYKNNLKPLCMAEFWWGRPPISEIRKHKSTYPACKSKCEPILSFMLEGLKIDENPIEKVNENHSEIKVLFESKGYLLVNKPADLLSVPGKTVSYALINLLRNKLNNNHLELVHRLDMATSGILIVTKNKYAYKFIQRQFIQRKVNKRYIAILDGNIEENHGEISLPLIVDLNNRPYQKVCYENGKTSLTRFEKIADINGRSKVYFYPETGRTHQLRVHAAHKLGLKTPILGDDLYGRKDKRLFLHANKIEFICPDTKKPITITCSPNF